MDNQIYNQIVSFIWSIADDCLRDVYVRGKYRDVILPMTVIRRLDAVLEETKKDVLAMKKTLDEANVLDQTGALCHAAGEAFCNSSPFTLKDLTSRSKQQQLKADFIAYLDGFSPNVQEILEKFKFRNQLDTMVDADILGAVIEKFVSPTINLSPKPVLDDKGAVKIPALDNHTMGVIFEELIRKFNEENNEEAGEHFTPRDVVELMADVIFMPIQDKINDGTYLVYDGASGTGGMLTIAEQRLLELAEQHYKQVSIHLFGQEINPETYAITKADMLIKGEGEEVDNIIYGSTLSSDGLPTKEFDFMLSNPPYGKAWKTDAEKLGGKSDITDSRFVISFGDEPDFKMIPRISDGQMLFLANNISKMKHGTELGSRIAEVHNGSSLFTGDAGGGESNLRRYIIESDYLEAIIALPENMFYNTGIATFIWIVTNRKAPSRRGKVQLIDATGLKSPLRKNLGNKNCELTPELRAQITDLLIRFEENEHSKIFDNNEFGYWKITVERPQRFSFSTNSDRLHWLPKIFLSQYKSLIWSWSDKELNGTPMPQMLIDLYEALSQTNQTVIYYSLKEFLRVIDPILKNFDLSKKQRTVLLFNVLGEIDPNGDIYCDGKGKPLADKALTDTEQIPLNYEGGIQAFFEKEVLTFAPDAWIDESKTQVGYEISFTKYFYKPVILRTLDEIRADIVALEKETDGLLGEIIGGVGNE